MRPVTRQPAPSYAAIFTKGRVVTNQEAVYMRNIPPAGPVLTVPADIVPAPGCQVHGVGLVRTAAFLKVKSLNNRLGQGQSKDKPGWDLFDDFTKKGGWIVEFYHFARRELIENFGQYCSYCETPVQDDSLAVEHMLDKSIFPDQGFVYDNFSLCCVKCNSIKGNRPNYNQLLQWANIIGLTARGKGKKARIIGSTITQVQYNQTEIAMQCGYMWPLATARSPYQTFQHKLIKLDLKKTAAPTGSPSNPYYVARGTNISPLKSTDTGNSFVGVCNNFVYANIRKYKGAGYVTIPIAVTITGTTPPPTPPVINATQASSQAMVALIGLNRLDIHSTFSDRRIANRTKVWLQAIEAYNHLSAVPLSPLYDLMFNQVLSTARQTGFYSVWVTVFNQLATAFPSPSGATAGAGATGVTALTARFINDSATATYFPGTNISNTIP